MNIRLLAATLLISCASTALAAGHGAPSHSSALAAVRAAVDGRRVATITVPEEPGDLPLARPAISLPDEPLSDDIVICPGAALVSFDHGKTWGRPAWMHLRIPGPIKGIYVLVPEKKP